MSNRKAEWLEDLLGPLMRPDLVLEPLDGQPRCDFPSSYPEPIGLELPESSADTSWLESLEVAFQAEEWSTCAMFPLVVPLPGTLAITVEWPSGRQLKLVDQAAFVASVLRRMPACRSLAILVSQNLLTQLSSGPFRGWLAASHRPSWIVCLGASAAKAMKVTPHFAMALLVIEAGSVDAESADSSGGKPGPHLVRLADLRDLERDDWGDVLRNALRRQGDEKYGSIILRDPDLGEDPWTYERYSKSFEEVRADARELGSFRDLRHLVTSTRAGVQLKLMSELRVRVDGSEDLPEGVIRCFGTRSVTAEGALERPYYVRGDGVGKDLLLAAGDVLVRLSGNPRHEERPVWTAQVREEHLPATFERRVLALRFRTDLDPQVKELVIGYLGSRPVRDALIAAGVAGSLSSTQLSRLEVPYPRDEVLKAFSRMKEAEEVYRGWEREAREARQALFDATGYAKTIPKLLMRVRQEEERVRAARDSQSLDYQVRNYYPHPIALRRQGLYQESEGEKRMVAIFDCAEHLLTYVAILSMVQVADGHDLAWQATAQIRTYAESGLRMDWGKWVTLIEEGASLTARHANPLVLPFPELGTLAASAVKGEPRGFQVQRRLQEQRNNRAHLQRHPEPELRQMSEELVGHLDELLESVSFLGAIPLVNVEDYALDPISGDRTATFKIRQGVSPIFRRESRGVSQELARGSVGVLDAHQRFRALSPWLMLAPCPACGGSEEIFVFNRLESDSVVYVEMATGHPLRMPDLLPRWKRMLSGEA